MIISQYEYLVMVFVDDGTFAGQGTLSGPCHLLTGTDQLIRLMARLIDRLKPTTTPTESSITGAKSTSFCSNGFEVHVAVRFSRNISVMVVSHTFGSIRKLEYISQWKQRQMSYIAVTRGNLPSMVRNEQAVLVKMDILALKHTLSVVFSFVLQNYSE